MNILPLLLPFILLLFSFGFLYIKENEYIVRKEGLYESFHTVSTLPHAIWHVKNNGHLLHLQGYLTKYATTSAILHYEDIPLDKLSIVDDNDFEFSVYGYALTRSVEMYQYEEERHTTRQNERETITYTYHPRWSDQPINSDLFHERYYYRNPKEWKIQGKIMTPNSLYLGQFHVFSEYITQLKHRQNLKLTVSKLESMRKFYHSGAQNKTAASRITYDETRKRYQLDNQELYIIGEQLQTYEHRSPRIGDLRITFSYLPCEMVSIIAKQEDKQLLPYQTKNHEEIYLIEDGKIDSHEMINHARRENEVHVWMYRCISFLTLSLGLWILLDFIKSNSIIYREEGILVFVQLSIQRRVLRIGMFLVVVYTTFLLHTLLLAIIHKNLIYVMIIMSLLLALFLLGLTIS